MDTRFVNTIWFFDTLLLRTMRRSVGLCVKPWRVMNPDLRLYPHDFEPWVLYLTQALLPRSPLRPRTPLLHRVRCFEKYLFDLRLFYRYVGCLMIENIVHHSKYESSPTSLLQHHFSNINTPTGTMRRRLSSELISRDHYGKQRVRQVRCHSSCLE